jgi:hypothetical protein
VEEEEEEDDDDDDDEEEKEVFCWFFATNPAMAEPALIKKSTGK